MNYIAMCVLLGVGVLSGVNLYDPMLQLLQVGLFLQPWLVLSEDAMYPAAPCTFSRGSIHDTNWYEISMIHNLSH